MGTIAAVGSLAVTAVGTGVSMAGQSAAAGRAATMADNNAKQSAFEAQKSNYNAVLAMYKAQNVQAQGALDLSYLGFSTDIQAQWQSMMGGYSENLTKASAANQYLIGAENARFQIKGMKSLAETQAAMTEDRGERQAAQIMAQTNYRRVMQSEEDAQKLGLLRASAGARMVAYSGSSLDVLKHEEAMANLRQTSIAVLGGMQADDVQYDANAQANYVRQQASVAAQNLEQQYSRDPMADPVLQAKIAQAQVTTQHDVALTRMDGWRKALLLQRDIQDKVSGLTEKANQYMQGAGSDLNRVVEYENKASAALEDGAYGMAKTGLDGLGKMIGTVGDKWGGAKTGGNQSPSLPNASSPNTYDWTSKPLYTPLTVDYVPSWR